MLGSVPPYSPLTSLKGQLSLLGSRRCSPDDAPLHMHSVPKPALNPLGMVDMSVRGDFGKDGRHHLCLGKKGKKCGP